MAFFNWRQWKDFVVNIATTNLGYVLAVILISSPTLHAEIIQQMPGLNHCVFEAEYFDSIADDIPTGFARVDTDTQMETDFWSLVFPKNSNTSGGTVIMN